MNTYPPPVTPPSSGIPTLIIDPVGFPSDLRLGSNYQQYDQTGFQQNVQQPYQAAPQQQQGSTWPFGDSDPLVGGGLGADGGVGFSGGGYPDQGQQQQQQQHPYQQGMLMGGMVEQSAEASKVS